MRSGKYAAKLKQDGIEAINLRGSIIAWVSACSLNTSSLGLFASHVVPENERAAAFTHML